MACFVVSAIGAAGVAIARHVVKKNEEKVSVKVDHTKFGSQTKWSTKLKYLELTLSSGSFILAIEHILHGEVTPYAPFLTAANNAEDTKVMLQEMGTVGVTMFLVLVVAWMIGVFAYDYAQYKKCQTKLEKKDA